MLNVFELLLVFDWVHRETEQYYILKTIQHVGCLGNKNEILKVARQLSSRQFLMSRFDHDKMDG